VLLLLDSRAVWVVALTCRSRDEPVGCRQTAVPNGGTRHRQALEAVGRLCVAGLSVRLVTARRWEFLEGIVTSVSEGPRLVTRDSRTARRAGWEEMLGGRGAATATRRKEQTCTT